MLDNAYQFGRYDRVTVNGIAYRAAGKEGRSHVLQSVSGDGEPSNEFKVVSDKALAELYASEKILVDDDYFSLAKRLLRARGEPDNMDDLSPEELQTATWKAQWCIRFNRARLGGDGSPKRYRVTPGDLAEFIDSTKEAMADWYLRTYGTNRPPGRRFRGAAAGSRKRSDHPSPSTLRDWLKRFKNHGCKSVAFRPGYRRCGNRNQLDPLVERALREAVEGYASRAKPTIADVHEDALRRLARIASTLPEGKAPYVSERTVRRHVHKLPPLRSYAGRHGEKRAKLAFTPVGDGMATLDGMEALERMDRVEMDDWEMDLFAVLNHRSVRPRLRPAAARAFAEIRKKLKANPVRCTVTAAIDVATKCIVGLHVTPSAPSTAGSRTALRTIVTDKVGMGVAATAETPWTMTARPVSIATDGGPAFMGDFHDAVVRLGIRHDLPGTDPRSRGTIEAFFRVFKRFCRFYTGQSFSNVVQRGDYQSEELASVLASDLEPLLIRFVLDWYHQNPHEGLGKVRPLTAWQRAGNDLSPPPDHVQRHLALGYRLNDRVVRADGITVLNLQYKHPGMGKLRALVGSRALTVVVDANDMGTILVAVPNDAKVHFEGGGDYLSFKANGMAKRTLESHLGNSRVLRRFQHEEEEAGRPVRLNALEHQMTASEKARSALGLQPMGLSLQAFERLVAAMERRGAVATSPATVPMGPASHVDDGIEGVGSAAPRGSASRPSASAKGRGVGARKASMNSYDPSEDVE